MVGLPLAPSDWDLEKTCVIHSSLKGFPLTLKIEAVGEHYQIYSNRKNNSRTLSEHERHENEQSKTQKEEEDLSDDEEEGEHLMDLDPKDWKNQDHYEVLGLSKYRYKTTDEQLKKAFRKKVLKHHPDKKAQSGGSVDDDNFFKCVQKAYEVIADPVQKLNFDSVDPTFDESLPSEKEVSKNFFKVLGPVFEANARFSKKQPVPGLGDDNSTAQQVNKFYDFWYNFDSWRIFNYLDEEDTMAGENREDKRHIEKKNLKARAERKKADNTRIRLLTDLAMKYDPRLKKFKDQEKEKREAKEKAKKKIEEEERLAAEKKAEEERQLRLKAEQEEKAKLEEEKKGKEAVKNNLRKFRKNIRQLVKDQNYYLASTFTASSKEMIEAMIQLEKVCESSTYEDLNSLNDLAQKNPDAFEPAYRDQLRKFYEESALPPQRDISKEPPKPKETERPWSDEEKKLLIQAVKLFPGGTQGRWDKIAAHVNEHSKLAPRTTKDVTKEAENIKSSLDAGKIVELESNKIVKKHNDTLIKDAPTQRSEEELEKAKAKPSEKKEKQKEEEKEEKEDKEEKDERPWSKEEQAALETALRQIPANEEGRWEKVAAAVGTRTKKECMVRCKRLAQKIKDKKGGQ